MSESCNVAAWDDDGSLIKGCVVVFVVVEAVVWLSLCCWFKMIGEFCCAWEGILEILSGCCMGEWMCSVAEE